MNGPDSIDEHDEHTLLLRYLDGSLPPEAVAKLNTHLKHSTEARRELAGLLVQEIQLIELGHAKRAAIHTSSPADGTAGATREPRAEATLVRVPASVWRGWKRPRRAGWVLAAAAGLILFFGIDALWFNPRTGLPVLALATGAQLRLEREGNTVSVSDGLALRPGDLLDLAGTNAIAITYLPEKTRVELQPGTTLKLLSWSRGKRFEMRQGQIAANVARQRPFKPMLVRTPQAEARVLGTEFTLTTTTKFTRLDVTVGRVRLTRASDGAKLQVCSGEYVIAAAKTELAALPQTGGIVGEYWTNLPGIYVRSLEQHPRFPDRPDKLIPLDAFEAPPNWGDNYGARFRGYVHPPVTGEYTFWSAGSNEFFLFISPDDKPAGSQRVCYGRNIQPSDWDRPQPNEAAQESAPIHMEAGRKYYIEALLKASVGEDHLAVAWRIPGREREIIPGKYLSPFKIKK